MLSMRLIYSIFKVPIFVVFTILFLYLVYILLVLGDSYYAPRSLESVRNICSKDLKMVDIDDIDELKDMAKLPGRLRGAQKYRVILNRDMPPETQPGWVKSDQEIPVSRFPKALLLGFAKCGTSTLTAFLNLHPAIVSLGWEIDYFCNLHYNKYAMSWYRNRMPLSFANQTTIEKSPCYITEPEAIPRIHAFNSSIKLMVIVRDPITRILSEYSHYREGFLKVGKTPLPIEQTYLNKSGGVKEYWTTKWGAYDDRMERLYDVFPREQILVLDGDAFVKDPLPQLQQVERFLGLKKYFRRDDFFFDKNKGFFCYKVRATGESKCMGEAKGRPHVDLSPELRKKLLTFLKPHTERFFQQIGKRYDWQTL